MNKIQNLRYLREIAKLPSVPKMNKKLMGALTELCFFERKIISSDLLFVFGSNILHDHIAAQICKIIESANVKTVLITGGIANYQNSHYDSKPESESILFKIPSNKYPGIKFLIEKKSRNTLENVSEANALYDLNSIISAIFISHSYASMRSYLTLTGYCASKNYTNYSIPIPSDDEKYPVNKDSWHKTKFGQSLVWGEFLRFLKYGGRGDFPIKDLHIVIEKIKKLTNYT